MGCGNGLSDDVVHDVVGDQHIVVHPITLTTPSPSLSLTTLVFPVSSRMGQVSSSLPPGTDEVETMHQVRVSPSPPPCLSTVLRPSVAVYPYL